VGTVIQDAQRGNDDRHQRWDRIERAGLFERSGDLQAQGLSQRHAAKVLEVPRSTLQAWRTYHERLDASPAVVAFFQSVPGLAFLHRLVLAIHLVCVEVGACGIRLVCLLLTLTGLDRFVGASYGTQQQVNRQVEEAIVRYRQEESARLAQDMPAKDITLAKDETFTGGLCLVAMEPKSNYIVLEQTAHGRDHATWHALMEKALAGLNCRVIQSTSDEASGLKGATGTSHCGTINCAASSYLVCCTRDADDDAHARRGGNHLYELETSRRVQRAILLLGTLLPTWTDEHIEVTELAKAGGIAREQDFFDEE
jgi:hypothetical protein